MATVEIDGRGRVRINDPGKPDYYLPLVRSETVTVWHVERYSIADTAVQTVNFGSVTAGKWFAVFADGNVKVEINSMAPRVIGRVLVWDDPSGAITAAKIENASGATRVVDVLVAG